MIKILKDKCIFSPIDIDKNFRPIGNAIKEQTEILGTFNPGATILPNGNILLMIRVAEKLKKIIKKDLVRGIRWDKEKTNYVIDNYKRKNVDTTDPRVYKLNSKEIFILTSSSWLLPVEIEPNEIKIKKIYYEKVIFPTKSFQSLGIEDPRITKIKINKKDKYLMTVVGVSHERLCTSLYISDNGLDYKHQGIILDDTNKDAIIFPKIIDNKFYMLTRPMKSGILASPPESNIVPGHSINLAKSPSNINSKYLLKYWKPTEHPLLQIKKGERDIVKIGGCAPPILTKKGWAVLFHGVEKIQNDPIGKYLTFLAYLDTNNPEKLISVDYKNPILEANFKLDKHLEKEKYVNNVVFTTGVVTSKNSYILFSGQGDLICRATEISKESII